MPPLVFRKLRLEIVLIKPPLMFAPLSVDLLHPLRRADFNAMARACQALLFFPPLCAQSVAL
jgi:hypothetical protein